jgi:hypothetical protein
MDEKVFRECGDGWESLIAPLEAEVERLGGRVDQIKEKFAGLRFYYSEPLSDFEERNENAWDALELAVDAAEKLSRHTCEICGKPGVGMMNNRGSWMKTLCEEDALLLGYKKVTK